MPIGVLAVALALGGCAAMHRQEARSQDDLLTAAGFRMKPADTPEKAARLAALPPLHMEMRTKDGNQVYSYADPYACECLLVGGPEEYARYRRLALEKEIADEKLQASMAEEDAAMDWQMWGPWWW